MSLSLECHDKKMYPKNLMTKIFLKYYEKVLCHITVFIITPCFFIFEMSVVRPAVIEMYEFGIVKQYLHAICPTFCFFNVVGNMAMSILTDTRLKGSLEEGTYCELCKMLRPPRSWHCDACNACIVRRDHHCFFFSRCIGLYNQRYYVSYVGYVTVSMAYSAYYNYLFIRSKYDEFDMIVSCLRILNPFLRFVIPEPMGLKDLYVLLLVTNVGLLIWSFSLFYVHMRNALRGVTVRESRHHYGDNKSNWRENIIKVFGDRWRLAAICPFICSPLPDISKLD